MWPSDQTETLKIRITICESEVWEVSACGVSQSVLSRRAGTTIRDLLEFCSKTKNVYHSALLLKELTVSLL